MKLVLDDDEVIENPSPEQIRAAVKNIDSGIYEFLRLEREGGLFLQATKSHTDCIVVEKFDCKEGEILVTEPPVMVEKAIGILQGYLAGGRDMKTSVIWVELPELSPCGNAHHTINKRAGRADAKGSLRSCLVCILIGFGISISAAIASSAILQVPVQHRLGVKAFLLLCGTFVLAGCCHSIEKGQIQGRFYMLKKQENPVMFALTVGMWCGFGVVLAVLTAFVR